MRASGRVKSKSFCRVYSKLSEQVNLVLSVCRGISVFWSSAKHFLAQMEVQGQQRKIGNNKLGNNKNNEVEIMKKTKTRGK